MNQHSQLAWSDEQHDQLPTPAVREAEAADYIADQLPTCLIRPAKVRKIIHVDMDAYYASVEQRDKPALKGLPVVVGGLPEDRGVVATASYEARQFGIHSAMPSRTAFKKCPQVVFLRPRFEVYRLISEQIRQIFYRYTDLVEPLSLDEAYLDVTENKMDSPSATLIAREIREAIFNETGLTASAGVSINKFLAKTASSVNKPNGLYLIPPEQAQAFVETLPIEKFYGIGDVTAEKMRRLGIHNGSHLRAWTETDLLKQFGKVGSYYFQIAQAKDDRPVVANRIVKSVGAEESFSEDLSCSQAMHEALKEIAQTVARRLAKLPGAARTLTLKVKYADYCQITRSRTLAMSISDCDTISKVAVELLETTEVTTRRARLLGITMSNLDNEDADNQPHCIQLKIDWT